MPPLSKSRWHGGAPGSVLLHSPFTSGCTNEGPRACGLPRWLPRRAIGPGARRRHRLRPTARPRPGPARRAPRPTRRDRIDLDAHVVGSTPELFGRQLHRDERWWSGGGARKGRHVDAGARAAGGDEGAERCALGDRLGEHGDHGRGGDTAAVHADRRPAYVTSHPVWERFDGSGDTGLSPWAPPVVAKVRGRARRRRTTGRQRGQEAPSGGQAGIGGGRVLVVVAVAVEILTGRQTIGSSAPPGPECDAIGDDRPLRAGATTHSHPAVSRTNVCVGSATKNDES